MASREKFSSLGGRLFTFFLVGLSLGKVILGKSRLEAADLLSLRYLDVLQASCAIDVDFAFGIACEEDRQGSGKLHGCLRNVDFISGLILIEVADYGGQVVRF